MNWAWMNEQVLLNRETDAIWKQVGLQMLQFNGLLTGSTVWRLSIRAYIPHAARAAGDGDLYDLEPALP